MKQYFCALCGETRFNSNAMDRRIVSQSLIRKCNGGELPEPLQPATHFFWDAGFACLVDDRGKPVVYFVVPESAAAQAGLTRGIRSRR